MEKAPTISTYQFKRHIEVYEKLCGQFDYDYYRLRFGVTQKRLDDPEYRVPLSAATAFFRMTAKESNDPTFGLTWVSKVPFAISSNLVRKVGIAPDVRNFLVQNIRLSRITSELADFSLEPYDEHTHILKMVPTQLEDITYHQIDASMLFVKNATQFFLKSRYPETQNFATDFVGVLFEHDCPNACIEKYDKAFNHIPVHFNQNVTGILILNEWLNIRLTPVDKSINDIVACELENARLDGKLTHSEVVAQCIASLLPFGQPLREEIAEALDMSLRTFQRKLSEENTTFKKLLESVRQRLAKDYIERDCYPLEDVAFLLGYSNITAFYAAYRRWYNSTPRADIKGTSNTEV